MTESPAKLAKHAYVCLADERLIFSDVRHDRYQCLDLRNTQTALRLFPQIRSLDLLGSSDSDQEQVKRIDLALKGAGLLVDGNSDGKLSVPVRIAAPKKSFDLRQNNGCPQASHCMAFLKAALSASAKYRFLSLQRIIEGVHRRKSRQADLDHNDPEKLLELVAVFHRLRPYYVREYLCRFDSLALIEFLAHYRHFPEWVFGVTGEPFAAHCWVQEGNMVLNDTVDFVRRFTPIMAF
ncbi:lasso peptide biosynthesis B2 protein [Woeseia oceani]|uniref:Microcin J25-processing protein McjB C-terminal domain-containing protein n=1 Tax=Woeseia oceani TaxID=1548547 RepID=A0A193LCB0_9GAMM|nr:lasso peptide biosynthesis B2 protein [Woeseia oceani]ANO50071.1 hypothetical protein BA177_01505 [Woeseia oceani]